MSSPAPSFSLGSVVTGVSVAVAAACLYLYVKERSRAAQLASTQADERVEYERMVEFRKSERQGRVAAEKALRNIRHELQQCQARERAREQHVDASVDGSARDVASASPSSSSSSESDTAQAVRRDGNRKKRGGQSTAATTPSSSGSYMFEPIGILESVYKKRIGTPRQGLVVEAGRARVRVRCKQASQALEGLADFTHCWVLFVFHNNTNTHKTSYRAKVHPPRMNNAHEGQRTVGLFGTRTPHRPCPIGISVCRIESITGAVVNLSGIDLIDGTPILDLKPYVHGYDDLGEFDVIKHNASWLSHDFVHFDRVQWEPEAEAALNDAYQGAAARRTLAKSMYTDSTQARHFIDQVLATDIRPAHRLKETDVAFRVPLDAFIVEYSVATAESVVTVLSISIADGTTSSLGDDDDNDDASAATTTTTTTTVQEEDS